MTWLVIPRSLALVFTASTLTCFLGGAVAVFLGTRFSILMRRSIGLGLAPLNRHSDTKINTTDDPLRGDRLL